MEEQASQAGPRQNRGKNAGRALDRQRRRAEELLAAQRARLQEIETNVTAQLDVLTRAVAAETNLASEFADEESRQRAQAVGLEVEELNRARLELAESERRWADEQLAAADQLRQEQEELQRQQVQIEAAGAQVRQTERDLKLAREEQTHETEQIGRREARCAELEKRLAYEHDQLELLREQTKTQRRRIAQELKAERASQQRELDRLRHDVELLQTGQRQSFDQAAKQLSRERAELEAKLDREREELRRQKTEFDEKELALQATQRQLETGVQQLARERSDEADGLRQEIGILKRGLATAEDSAAKTVSELTAWQASHEKLHKDHEELRHADEKLHQTHDELRQNHAALEGALAALQQSHQELGDRHNRQTQAHDELQRTHGQLLESKQRTDQALAALDQLHHELRDSHDRQMQAHDELRRIHAQLLEAKQRTDQALATLEQLHHELRDAHDRQTHDFAELRHTHEQMLETKQHTEQALAALEQSHGALRQQHEQVLESAQLAQEALGALEQSHHELRDSHDRQARAYDELRQAHEQLLETQQQTEQTLAAQSATSVVDENHRSELSADREELIARLAEAESKLAKADLQRNDELQRRFEMAVEDVRTLKRKNSELEEQVLGLKAAGLRPAAAPSAGSDSPNWEATKRRMLESLEADTDSNEERTEERIAIESTILITDDVVARKDHEIAELKLLLSQQSSNIGSVAVGAAAIASALDQDELILQERTKLAQMQEEWKSKLRQAEIDISVERARITRDRAEIEEKLATYAKERSKQGPDGATAGEAAETAKKPTRGRWLARLGLKDTE